MTLLLPFAPPSTSNGTSNITPDLIREHLAICDVGGAKDGSIVVTLNGYVGKMEHDNLTFFSFLPLTSSTMTSLLDPSTRANTLARIAVPSSLHPTSTFPSFTPLLFSSTLPFPPPSPTTSSPSTTLSPPSLPPRPRAVSGSGLGTAAASRLSNPFASFFGAGRHAAAAAPPPPPPAPERSPSPVPRITIGDLENEAATASGVEKMGKHDRRRASSPGMGGMGGEADEDEAEEKEDEEKSGEGKIPGKEAMLVSAWGIDKAIRGVEIEKAVGKALRDWVKTELTGLPSGVVSGTSR
jgi:hypothetical protein